MTSDVAVNHQVFVQGDRTLYGFDAELHQKHADKWDKEAEKRVLEWIFEMTGDRLQNVVDLKSGVTLCKLVNRARPNFIARFNSSGKLSSLHERDNVKLFLEACVRLGVPKQELFHVEDLYEQKWLTGVLVTLYALGRVLQSRAYHCPKLQVFERPPAWQLQGDAHDSLAALIKQVGAQIAMPAPEVEKVLYYLARERVHTVNQLLLLYHHPSYWQKLAIAANLKAALAPRLQTHHTHSHSHSQSSRTSRWLLLGALCTAMAAVGAMLLIRSNYKRSSFV